MLHMQPEVSRTMGKKNKKGKDADICATGLNTLDTVPDLSLTPQENGHDKGTAYNGESSNVNENQLAPAREFDPENHLLIQAATAMDASLCEAQRRFKAFRKTCQSETLCRERDAKINQQKSAILELDSIREGVRIKYEEMCQEVQATQRALDDERQAFEDHKAKEEKIIKAKRAENELEIKKELAHLKDELEKETSKKLHKSLQELEIREEEIEQMKQEMKKKNAELRVQLVDGEKMIVSQKLKLKAKEEEYEEQVVLKKSFKDEKTVLHDELVKLENEFAIGGHQPEH